MVFRAAVSFAAKPGSIILSYGGSSYFLLLLLAAGFAIRNGIQNTLGSRPFWVLPPSKEHANLFTAESWDRLQRAVWGALQAGTSYELDVEIIGSGSSTKWATTRGEPVRDTDGQIIGLRGIVQDITKRKRADEALRESEDKLRLILDSTAEAIYGIDIECRCTFCNPACLRALGYEHADELLGKNMHHLIHRIRGDGTPLRLEE